MRICATCNRQRWRPVGTFCPLPTTCSSQYIGQQQQQQAAPLTTADAHLHPHISSMSTSPTAIRAPYRAHYYNTELTTNILLLPLPSQLFFYPLVLFSCLILYIQRNIYTIFVMMNHCNYILLIIALGLWLILFLIFFFFNPVSEVTCAVVTGSRSQGHKLLMLELQESTTTNQLFLTCALGSSKSSIV